MQTPVKLAAYVAALAVLAAGAWGVGAAVGPVTSATPASDHGDTGGAAGGHATPASGEHGASGSGGHGDAGEHGTAGDDDAAHLPGGLASSVDGYTLVPATTTLPAGVAAPFAFSITGPDGAPVTAFDVEHDKRMHLVVVRRDTTGYRHVHPEMAPDGTWTVPLTLPAGGSYRVFADFTPTGGEGLTLGVDVAAPGAFEPVPHAPTRVAEVDGYTVELAGRLVPGESSRLTLIVSRGGVQVTDLEPYLGAYGHLVALRGGDLAYLHVHPEGSPGDGVTAAGPRVTFAAEVPSAGTYRLFLDFAHGGVVRTAEFTLATAPADAAAPGDPTAPTPAPADPAAPSAPTGAPGDDHTHGG